MKAPHHTSCTASVALRSNKIVDFLEANPDNFAKLCTLAGKVRSPQDMLEALGLERHPLVAPFLFMTSNGRLRLARGGVSQKIATEVIYYSDLQTQYMSLPAAVPAMEVAGRNPVAEALVPTASRCSRLDKLLQEYFPGHFWACASSNVFYSVCLGPAARGAEGDFFFPLRLRTDALFQLGGVQQEPEIMLEPCLDLEGDTAESTLQPQWDIDLAIPRQVAAPAEGGPSAHSKTCQAQHFLQGCGCSSTAWSPYQD